MPATKVTPAEILNTPTTDTNPGDAGGTRNYINLGGLKICWGTTASIAPAANTEVTRSVTFPVGFFSATPAFNAFISTASGSVTNNILIGSSLASTAGVIYVRNNTGTAGVGGTVSWVAIGV